MVAESWILKMGNEVSSNIKNSPFLPHSSLKKREAIKDSKPNIGILSFEVANVMSKIVLLHKSLSHQELSKLKSEIIKAEGVKKLVSSDESYLLELACAEKMDDLNRAAETVIRLGKKCSELALQGFEHVYGDIVNGIIDVRELKFLVKDMEGMIRKTQRYVGSTSNLYREMKVLNELEQATTKFQLNQHEESRHAFEQKLMLQKQHVRHLKEVSLWNQTYDKIVEMMARTVCTIYARIRVAFGDGNAILGANDIATVDLSLQFLVGGASVSPQMKEDGVKSHAKFHMPHHLYSIRKSVRPQLDPQRNEVDLFQQELFIPCGPSPGSVFLECLSLGSLVSRVDNGDIDCHHPSSQSSSSCSMLSGMKRGNSLNLAQISVPYSGHQRQLMGLTKCSSFTPKSRIAMHATSSTVGGSALALHYANVISVIEKFLRYPQLVCEEARDDLYQMLPTSLRSSLKKNLKSYCKSLEIYDWKVTLDGILKWLFPLASNMIKWQSERNVEQPQIVERTNVLLLETLYFADREKTEAAICDLLVGLHFICRYEHQQNAMLESTSSFDFGDWMEWHLQCQASYIN
ncbi:hypothetical protein Nepgr_030372 [Nepenthes gracilis]|uniref:Uncharacterized protein n=1 Tax=Nepenthes gracilis TaxID=150966 RepID=A0AAD3Y602_NEPGR|nr:hypothetical protein Nepgr_030372 [Nepenthes gracilis]